MPEHPLVAHSLGEAYYYLMVQHCAACRSGALTGGDGKRLGDASGSVLVEIEAVCRSCHASSRFEFRLPNEQGLARSSEPTFINDSDEPSSLIDVAQWITLFRVTTEAAAGEPDKQAARLKGIEAAQCLEEALKFYDDPENDLPRDSALFTAESRRRMRDHPEQFSRQRLIELRAKLPALNVMRRSAHSCRSKPWWRFWG